MHSPSALTEHVSLNLARFFCLTLYIIQNYPIHLLSSVWFQLNKELKFFDKKDYVLVGPLFVTSAMVWNSANATSHVCYGLDIP